MPTGRAGRRLVHFTDSRLDLVLERIVTVFSPVGLDEDAIDLFEIHDADLVANGFDERAQTEVAGPAQESSRSSSCQVACLVPQCRHRKCPFSGRIGTIFLVGFMM